MLLSTWLRSSDSSATGWSKTSLAWCCESILIDDSASVGDSNRHRKELRSGEVWGGGASPKSPFSRSLGRQSRPSERENKILGGLGYPLGAPPTSLLGTTTQVL